MELFFQFLSIAHRGVSALKQIELLDLCVTHINGGTEVPVCMETPVLKMLISQCFHCSIVQGGQICGGRRKDVLEVTTLSHMFFLRGVGCK